MDLQAYLDRQPKTKLKASSTYCGDDGGLLTMELSKRTGQFEIACALRPCT